MNESMEEELLSAYIDGELTPAEKVRVEQWLESHPEGRRLVAELRRLRNMLSRLPSHRLEMSFGRRVLDDVKSSAPAGDAAAGSSSSTGSVGGLSALEDLHDVRRRPIAGRIAARIGGGSARRWLWPAAAVAAAILVMVFSERDTPQQQVALAPQRPADDSSRVPPGIGSRQASPDESVHAETSPSKEVDDAFRAPLPSPPAELREFGKATVARDANGASPSAAGADQPFFAESPQTHAPSVDLVGATTIEVLADRKAMAAGVFDEALATQRIVLSTAAPASRAPGAESSSEWVYVEAPAAAIEGVLKELRSKQAAFPAVRVTVDPRAASQQALLSYQWGDAISGLQMRRADAPSAGLGRIDDDAAAAKLDAAAQEQRGKAESGRAARPSRLRRGRLAGAAPSGGGAAGSSGLLRQEAANEVAAARPADQVAVGAAVEREGVDADRSWLRVLFVLEPSPVDSDEVPSPSSESR